MHNTTVLFYSRPTMEELWWILKGKSQLKIKFHWLMNWSERTQLWVFVVVVINNLRPFQKLVHFVIFAGLREKMYQHWKSRPNLKLQYKVQFAVDILTFKTKFYIKLKLAFYFVSVINALNHDSVVIYPFKKINKICFSLLVSSPSPLVSEIYLFHFLRKMCRH